MFRAFISYSHADEAWGAWLQRALENYRAPKSLAADLSTKGKPARLAPVFRDREDLPVAGDLNAAIKAALAGSQFQIVLCSPNAAASRWVNEEIKLFHKLHGPGRVFAVIIGGEPGASAIPGREAEECFPPALRFRLDSNGDLTETPAETLAADARDVGDGKRYAMLKVAAGMLGVGLDDLVRRDAQKRARRLWAITGASVTGMALTGVLSFVAVAKSIEATRMRGEAENLIEFMLGDLNKKLEPLDSLDVLESVVDRAIRYYQGQDLRSLDDAALARRAKAMMQIGTIEFTRNDLDAAQSAFEAAGQATGALLEKAPNDPDRVFNHAQSVFYLGQNALARGDLAEGERRYAEYLRFAQQLVSFDEKNSKWRLELAYATNNLGTVKYYAGDYDGAIANFSESTKARRALMEAAPNDRKIAADYAYALSWRALAELARGSYATAIELIGEQLGVYGDSAAENSEDYKTLDTVVTAQRRLAEANLGLGRVQEARDANAAALAIVERLTKRDPENANWLVNASHIHRTQSALAALEGDDAESISEARRALDFAKAACKRANCDERMVHARALALAARLTSTDSASGADDAAELERLLPQLLASPTIDSIGNYATASLALVRHERAANRAESARRRAEEAVRQVEPRAAVLPALAAIRLAGLYVEAGETQKAAAIIADIEARKVAHPELIALNERRDQPVSDQAK